MSTPEEQDIVKKAKGIANSFVDVMNEADALGIEIGFQGINRGKKNRYEMTGFFVKKDLTIDAG